MEALLGLWLNRCHAPKSRGCTGVQVITEASKCRSHDEVEMEYSLVTRIVRYSLLPHHQPCYSFGVARNRAELCRCTLLHEGMRTAVGTFNP